MRGNVTALRKRRIRNRPEQKLQIAVCEYLSYALPQDGFFFAVPNGGYRTPAEAGIMKAMGQKPGVPDIIIAYRGWIYGIEAKSAKGTISAAQGLTHVAMARAGVNIATCRSIEEVESALTGFGIPVHARVKARAA